MLVFLTIWTTGIYIMWLSAHSTMKRQGGKQVAGEFKAILELANAMQSQLISHRGNSEDDIITLSESELRRRVVQDLRGGAISYKTPQSSQVEHNCGDAGWEAVAAFLDRDVGWLTALVVSACASIVVGVCDLLPMLIVFVGITVSFIVAVCIGSTHESKGIIWWWSFWTLAVLPELIATLTLYFTYGSLQLRPTQRQW
jgi:hypothetical protein